MLIRARCKSLRIEAIHRVVAKYEPLENMETAVLIDIMISYRNIEAFSELYALTKQFPRYVFETVMVQEQYAFVLNRDGGKAKPIDEMMIREAESVLRKAGAGKGSASSESYGIWGRIYKESLRGPIER